MGCKDLTEGVQATGNPLPEHEETPAATKKIAPRNKSKSEHQPQQPTLAA